MIKIKALKLINLFAKTDNYAELQIEIGAQYQRKTTHKIHN